MLTNRLKAVRSVKGLIAVVWMKGVRPRRRTKDRSREGRQIRGSGGLANM